jgi:hypothetical protein
MKKLIAVFMIGLVLPFTAFAEKTPCWGEGGISHCESSRFVCNNGKTSVSKKICAGYDKKKIAKDKPVTHKPATDKPVTDKSIKDKPVTDKPVTDKSVTEKPAHVNIDITDSETVKKTEVTKSGELLKLEYQGFT